MKQPENGTTDRLDPEVERRLDAIDRALAGEEVDADLAGLAELAEDVAAERPEPTEQWALEMDAKAGERFGASRFGSIRSFFRGRSPRAIALPAMGLATVVVVIGAIGVADIGDDDMNLQVADPPPLLEKSDDAGGSSAAPVPSNAAPGDNSAYFRDSGAPEAAIAEETARRGLTGSADAALPNNQNAPGKQKRREDRNASLALKTETEDVRSVTDQAIQITETAGGVVLSSQLEERETEAAARLQLQVPTRELDPTLDQLTDLATVEALNELAEDITRPFISAQDRLQDARAERTELLEALGNASTEEEVDAIRGQLKDVRREISRAEAAFDNIARRARNSQVSLEINGSPGGGDDGNWSLGDAADDALSALKTVAGVMLIAAAILAPLAILALVITLITRSVRKSRRERALDEE